MKKITITLGLVLCASLSMFSQTAEERAQITANYDLEELKEIELNAQAAFEKRKERIREWASTSDQPLSKLTNDGSVQIIYDVIDNKPIYRSTLNRTAGIMQGANALWNGGSLGLNVEGQNMTVGIWEIGLIRTSHEAFGNRVTLIEGASANNQQPVESASHATHVTGTLIASGPNPVARGIASQASSQNYNSDNDNAEAATAAAAGLLVSNHSYGIRAIDLQNSGNRAILGKYTATATIWDNLVFNAPFYLPVFAAGNDRSSNANSGDVGYDLLNNETVAKNVMVVGATVGQLNYTGPSSVAMSSFSSWGPTDDGRVKPDISTKGVAMFSTESSTDSSYGVKQGTSMAAPAVAGGLILLQQYYNQLNSQFMLSATVKGLALHTALEAGANDGPDYQFGWGLMNTEGAAIAIRDNGSSALLEERNLTSSGIYSTSLTVNSSSKLVISISWADPFAIANSGPEDDPAPAIVNDLDLQVTDANGTIFYPWKLNPASFSAAATRNSTNDVDNFEKVEIDNPSGNYTIQVSHKGSLRGGSQDYSLIITGADPATFSTSGPDSLDKLTIYPNPANDRFTVSFNNQLSGDSINVNVYDVLGQLVISNKYDNTGVFEQTVDASTLNSGVYLVKVGNGVTSSTKKLIIR